MNPFPLFHIVDKCPEEGGFSLDDGRFMSESGVWACGNCRAVFPYKDKEWAEKCCICTYCGKPMPPKFPPKTYHQECLDKALQKSREDHEAKMEVVAPESIDWDKMCVFYHNDDVSTDPDDLRDQILYMQEELEDDETLPEFFEIGDKESWDGVSLDRILEDADEFCEDGSDHLCGIDEFESSIKEFNEANKEFYRWSGSGKKLIVADFVRWYDTNNPERMST